MNIPVRSLLLVCVLLSLFVFPAGCAEKETTGKEEKAEKKAVPVEIVKVALRDMEETIEAVGSLEASEQVMLRPEVSAVLERIHFEPGQRVRSGQELFTLDDDKIRRRLAARRAALDSTQVRMRNAERIFERRKQLLEQNVGTTEVMEEARTQYRHLAAEGDRLQAEIEEILEALKDYRIDSPIEAYIGDSLLDVGEYVETGDDLAVLVKIDPLELTFHIPERYAPQVDVGQTAKVLSAAAPGETFSARVFFINPRVLETTRDLQIKAHVENRKKTLRPGGFAKVKLTIRTLEDVVVIPEEALVPTRSGYMVFVVEKEVAGQREVKIGLRRPGVVQITQGLEPGLAVVRSGHISVSDGAAVKIVNPN